MSFQYKNEVNEMITNKKSIRKINSTLMMAFDAGKRSFVRTNEISIKEESEDFKVSA